MQRSLCGPQPLALVLMGRCGLSACNMALKCFIGEEKSSCALIKEQKEKATFIFQSSILAKLMN